MSFADIGGIITSWTAFVLLGGVGGGLISGLVALKLLPRIRLEGFLLMP